MTGQGMTLVGFALCVGILAITGTALLLDWRDRRWLARHTTLPDRETCPVCDDDQVIHLGVHMRLAHGRRPVAPEDSEDWA